MQFSSNVSILDEKQKNKYNKKEICVYNKRIYSVLVILKNQMS